MSLINSAVSIFEYWLYHDKIASQRIHPEPVFILGHPRTGTTHLHNLLAVDKRFAYVNTFQAGFPSGFLLLEKLSWCLGWLIDKTRPMDDMPLSFNTPAEDEIAVNMLTGGISPYACLTFMTRYKNILHYCTFENCTDDDREAWLESFLWFLKKVSFVSGGRPLIIKSPVHIGRFHIFKKIFPRAKFVFIHRDPITVFLSSAHMIQEYFTFCYLARPTDEELTEYILDQHALLYDVYFRERDSIPYGSLAEISFAELDADPISTMQKVYRSLQWTDFNIVAPSLQEYCCQLEGFKKNDHAPLLPSLRTRLERALGPVMVRLGYR